MGSELDFGSGLGGFAKTKAPRGVGAEGSEALVLRC